jgi:integrase
MGSNPIPSILIIGSNDLYSKLLPYQISEFVFLAKKNEEYLALLQDPNVRRWHSNTAKGSTILAGVYLRSLGRFCRAVNLRPIEFVNLPQDKMEDEAQDYIDKLESMINPKSKKAYSPSYIENCLTAIRSWAAWNRRPFQRTIKIKDANSTPTLDSERALTVDELQKLLYSDSTPLRTRASVALIIFSGCRPEVQGNFLGTEGLRIKDFPEMEMINNEEIQFKKIPTMVVVRKELSKIRKQYLTFLFEEGCLILKELLERRIKQGEKLDRDSGIIVSSEQQTKRANWAFGNKDTSPFLRTPKISEGIREAMRAVGIPFRPYVLRVSFDTALLTAEGKGMISHAYLQFVMGHSGDIERTYTLSKCALPEEVIEDIRASCQKASQFLQTQRFKKEESNLLKEFKEGLLLSKGKTPEQIKNLDVLTMSNEEFFKLLHGETSSEAPLTLQRDGGSTLIVQGQQQGRHTAIPLSQLQQFLASGCLYVDKYTDPQTSLPMAIVEFPA